MPKYGSLSFGTVWIEIYYLHAFPSSSESLSFGTVWIEISIVSPHKHPEIVTVLRDGVD